MPRHLIPLIIGLLGFAVTQAASETPSDEATTAASYGVQCIHGKIELSQLKQSMIGAESCLLSSFPSRAGAALFAKKNFGGTGAACRC